MRLRPLSIGMVLGAGAVLAATAFGLSAVRAQSAPPALRFQVRLTAASMQRSAEVVSQAGSPPWPGAAGPTTSATAPLDGRLLLLLSTDDSAEPRRQISDGPKTQLVFGIDTDGWTPDRPAIFGGDVLGYPLESLAQLPKGTYNVQALLHRYETFHRSRRPHREAAHGPRRGPAVAQRARQPLQHAAQGRHRSRRGRNDRDRARPGDPAHRPAQGHPLRPARAHPERAADEVLGPPDVPRCPRAGAGGIRPADGRALSARHRSRPLPGRLRRLPRRAAGSEPQARLQRALLAGRLQPHRAAGGSTTSTSSGRAARSRGRSSSRSSTRRPSTTTPTP